MIWPGEAVVHVSIVNWIKGKQKGKKRIYIQEGNDVDKGWRHEDFDTIGAALSFDVDVTQAQRIEANARGGGCFQGQTHGHKAFLMTPSDAKLLTADHPNYADVLFPFLTADDLIGDKNAQPSRYVIDFQGKDRIEAQSYTRLFKQLQSQVLPTRQAAADKEAKRNKTVLDDDSEAKTNKHHANFLRRWWLMSYPREEMIEAITALPRFIVCGQVTKRPIFEFVSPLIRPNAACTVFAHADDYSFGILQSAVHWIWFVNRCSTLKSDFRYDTFPWPQEPNAKAVRRVADAAVALRKKRDELRDKHSLSFRELYRSLELPGDHPLKVVHEALDNAVRSVYGMLKGVDPLAHLLDLNASVAEAEADGRIVQGPGLPDSINNPNEYITTDCLKP